MAWTSNRRRDATPRGWHKLRVQILERDDYRCAGIYSDGRACPERATDVDHIVPMSRGGSHDPSNLQAMCNWCHKRKSTAEGHAANREVPRVRRQRPVEQHPGLL